MGGGSSPCPPLKFPPGPEALENMYTWRAAVPASINIRNNLKASVMDILEDFGPTLRRWGAIGRQGKDGDLFFVFHPLPKKTIPVFRLYVFTPFLVPIPFMIRIEV